MVSRASRCQKAPSAKRCIKTFQGRSTARWAVLVRKHRVPKGALRLGRVVTLTIAVDMSESTERQKVH